MSAGLALTVMREAGNTPSGSLITLQLHKKRGTLPGLSTTASACSLAYSRGASWNAASRARLDALQETLGGCHLNSRTTVVIAAGVREGERKVPTREIPS